MHEIHDPSRSQADDQEHTEDPEAVQQPFAVGVLAGDTEDDRSNHSENQSGGEMRCHNFDSSVFKDGGPG